MQTKLKKEKEGNQRLRRQEMIIMNCSMDAEVLDYLFCLRERKSVK